MIARTCFFLPKMAFKGDVGTGCTEMLQKTWRFFFQVENHQKADES